MEFICLDHQPLSVVGDAGFKRLVYSLDPRYTLPGRKYFTDVCLPELYMTVYKHIDSLMKDDNIVSISFTSDIWSSSVSPLSMLSLTAQFIDDNFELQRVVLHSQEFSGSHTAETIAGAFKAMFLAWGIPQRKVHVILRDNARNMEKAMRDALYPSLPCMAHTLQLAVHEGILAQRTIKDIIAMGRRIVGHFKHSQLSYSKLFAIQKVVNGPDQQPKRLQQDVPTRWNSTVAMLKSLLEQKRALCSYAADYDDLPPLFTGSQWKLVENVITVLEPFEELTNKISKATASAADVIPNVRALIRLLEKTQDTDHGVKTTKDTVLDAVKRRFSTIESEELYTLATILDPRYKDRFFHSELKPQIRMLLSNVLATAAEQQTGEESLAASGSSGPPQKVPRTGLNAMYAELLAEDGEHEHEAADNAISSQINLYLSEPVIICDVSGEEQPEQQPEQQPLAFWKTNTSRFPALAQAARSYLCAPCTSVDSERLFSTAGLIIDEKRNRLTAKNAEMLIFTKVNLPFMLLKQEKSVQEKPDQRSD